MRDQDLEPKFSWTIALLVTGICFLLFYSVLELLNNHAPVLFLKISIAALALGGISGLLSLILRKIKAQ